MRFAALPLVIVVAIAATLTLQSGPAHETIAFGATGEQRIAFGIFTPGAPENKAAIQSFIAKVGRAPAIWHTYRNWDEDPFPRDLMQNPYDVGAVPMITWEPHGRDLRQMAQGGYDSYIRDSAREAIAWGRPILLRFAHEMNGNWYSWGLGVGGNSASDYVAAWRHVVSVFREEKATNVRWVWAPNTGSFGSLFPGDGWIDYIGLDGYNWGSKYGSWDSFEQVFDSSYRSITRLSRKPLLITEFGANSRGGDKPAWISHAYSSEVADRYPRIRALIWFDRDQDGADWRIDSSAASLTAFRAAIRSPRLDLSAADLLGAGDAPPPPTPPATDPAPQTDPVRLDGGQQPRPGSRMRCGVHPQRALRLSRMWTIDVPLSCDRAGASHCFGVIRVRHAGRTIGAAEVELRRGLARPVRIGLPGWARTSLVSRRRLAARVTLQTRKACSASPARRVTVVRR